MNSSDSLFIDSHDPKDYQILATLNSSRSATTYKARYVKSGTVLRIKVFHYYMGLEDIYSLTQSIFLAKQCINHSNIIGVYCTFKHGDQLWIVLPFTDAESLNSIINSSFRSGMSESRMAFVLNETLKGIVRIHEHGDVHERIDLDHVLVEKGKGIKLDLDLLSYNNNEDQTNGQHPSWMSAPDLRLSGKVDIWMFGLLALELFYGKIPTSDLAEFMRLVSRIKFSKKGLRSKNFSYIVKLVGGCFPRVCLRVSDGKMPSRLLGELMALCMDPNPLNRPTARELLNHEFFNKSHDHKFKQLKG